MESVHVSVPDRDEQPKNGNHEMSANNSEDAASGTINTPQIPVIKAPDETQRSSNDENAANPFYRLPEIVINRYVSSTRVIPLAMVCLVYSSV